MRTGGENVFEGHGQVGIYELLFTAAITHLYILWI
jgi:hypothetical protein